MGKIRNGLVSLIVGAGLVAGAGSFDRVGAGNFNQIVNQNKAIYEGLSRLEGYDSHLDKIEAEQRQKREAEQREWKRRQQTYNEPVQNNSKLEVKEFFAFTREGWNDKNNNGRVSGDEIDEIYKKGFNPDDHLIFDIHFKNENAYSTASFKIINTDTGKIAHNEFNKNFKFTKDIFYPNRNGIKLNSGNYIAIFEEQGLNPVVYKFNVKE